MSVVINDGMLDRYYTEGCEAMLAPSKKALNAAGVEYTAYRLVGAIAETIVEQAKQLDSTMIYMGTRGMTALSNMILGSITTRVLHLAHIPVVLIH
jgi:nucleotide-binding universal stress UspA family protein